MQGISSEIWWNDYGHSIVIKKHLICYSFPTKFTEAIFNKKEIHFPTPSNLYVIILNQTLAHFLFCYPHIFGQSVSFGIFFLQNTLPILWNPYSAATGWLAHGGNQHRGESTGCQAAERNGPPRHQSSEPAVQTRTCPCACFSSKGSEKDQDVTTSLCFPI